MKWRDCTSVNFGLNLVMIDHFFDCLDGLTVRVMIAVLGSSVPNIWIPLVITIERVDLLPFVYLTVVDRGFVNFYH